MLNLPRFEAEQKLSKLGDNLWNKEKIYATVLQCTESEEKADEAYSNWVSSRVNANKNPNATVNIEALTLAAAISELLPSKTE